MLHRHGASGALLGGLKYKSKFALKVVQILRDEFSHRKADRDVSVMPAGVSDAVYIGSKALFKRPVRLILALGHVHSVDVESKRKRLARPARINLGHHAR